ncbi:MAG: replicative DNA helicase [Spirochaetales bacterium]|jgi:replicative DNA helicase|nr:replicative DNA helicase [Spirochaetales bacterium]
MASELAGRVPPHNREAEKAVLGAVMIDQEAVSAALEFLRSDDFYVRAHGIIFSAVEYISNRGDVIDLITLTDEIKHRNVLDACGGLSYIASLTSDVPTTANIQYYARIVRNLSIRRRLLRISNDLISKSYDESEDTQEIVADAEKLIFDISDESAVTGKYRSSSQIVNETVNSIEKLYHAGGSYTGVPSGFVDLDDHTSGFQNSEFIVIGARPSVGKTAFALTMASYMAVRKKVPVGFFTLEMSGKSLMQRLFSAEARIDSKKLRSGMLTHSDFSKLTEAAGRLYEAPLFIEDTPNIKLLDLRSQARRMKKNEGVKIIFIDYIGLIESESKRNIPRHEQVAEISRSLKALARELDIPVVCLSQVGRQSEGKEPTLADLRESGSIEQDADVVMFIHKSRDSDKYIHQQDSRTKVETEIILAKQRNGPIGTIRLGFVPRYTKFETLTREKQQ